MARYRNPWIAIAADSWLLAFDASTVIALRAMKAAAGGAAAEAEASLMVAEKVQALAELQALAFTGGLGVSPVAGAAKTLVHYRRKVTANRRRLSRPRRP